MTEYVQCPECGESNRPLARFCHNCAARIQATAEPSRQDAAGPPTITGDSPAAEAPGDWPGDARPPTSDGQYWPQSTPGEYQRHPAARWDDPGYADGPHSLGSRLRQRWVVIPSTIVVLLAIAALAGWRLNLFGTGQSASRPPAPRTASAPAGLVTVGPSAPAVTTPVPPATPTPSATLATPAVSAAVATVEAYFSAINHKAYGRAWKLVGSSTGTSYAAFVSGFNGTAKDTVTILSAIGDVVSVRLSALHTNGQVQVFQGTYTVRHGVIVSSDIQQTS